MPDSNIRFEAADAIGVLTIDRPKSLNALNPETLREILRRLRDVRREATLRAMIVTGAGERAFVAGADIAEMSTMSVIAAKEMARLGQRVTSALEDLPFPVIAAVNGFALGGGMELAMACDLVIASEKARFGQPEINLGTMPGAGGTQRLPRFIGKAKAMDLCLTGRMMDATEAERAGLVSRIVPADKLMEEAVAVAEKIGQLSRPISMMVKESVNRAFETTLAEGVRFERRLFHSTFATEDQKEGMAAFIDKRKPAFRNR
jgi:enoyl-CoA hydratase